MGLSKSQKATFLNFSARVRAVITNLLGGDASHYDALVETLDDDEKLDLIHIGELEAAAMALGTNSADLIDGNGKLSEQYSEFKRDWLKVELSKPVEARLKTSLISEELSDLEDQLEHLELDLAVMDDEDKDELQQAISDAESTLENLKVSVATIRQLCKEV